MRIIARLPVNSFCTQEIIGGLRAVDVVYDQGCIKPVPGPIVQGWREFVRATRIRNTVRKVGDALRQVSDSPLPAGGAQ